MNFAERAQQDTTGLLQHAGIEYREGKHFDCPLCGGKDKARITHAVEMVGGAWVCPSCTGNQYKPILDLTYRHSGLSFRDYANEIEKAGIVSDDWKPEPQIERKAFGYTPSMIRKSRYLQSRGLDVPPGLRFGYHAGEPVMVGDVKDAQGWVIGRHFTFLYGGKKRAETPRKYQKRYDNSPTVGRIELMPHDGILGVAEGIETALAASKIHGMAVWACIDARQLSQFQPPNNVHELHIFGDFDESGTGQSAAWELYRRVHAMQRRRNGDLLVVMPEFPGRGGDWNDFLLERAA